VVHSKDDHDLSFDPMGQDQVNDQKESTPVRKPLPFPYKLYNPKIQDYSMGQVSIISMKENLGEKA
jgi:hypothetical protein